MATNSSVIISLCSQLCLVDGIKPFEPREWSNLAEQLMKLGMQPTDLLNLDSDDYLSILGIGDSEAIRIQKLLGRSGSIAFEIAEYENIGVKIVTRADSDYPKKLKKKLGRLCPPLFYYSGDLNIFNTKSIAYVGSRSVSSSDIDFTITSVKKSLDNDYTIVSGGAKGIDSVSSGTALRLGGKAIEFLADSMLRRLKSSEVYDGIQNGQLLLASFVKPNSGFNVGTAMARNKFIYAQADGAVVIKSDLNKGGTWSGATEDLKNSWCPLLCWSHLEYPGNQSLIQKGAVPIDDSWDGSVPKNASERHKNHDTPLSDTQISLFD